MGLAKVVWTLGLAERTEPLALPYTVTCSTCGPSVDCMAVEIKLKENRFKESRLEIQDSVADLHVSWEVLCMIINQMVMSLLEYPFSLISRGNSL